MHLEVWAVRGSLTHRRCRERVDSCGFLAGRAAPRLASRSMPSARFTPPQLVRLSPPKTKADRARDEAFVEAHAEVQERRLLAEILASVQEAMPVQLADLFEGGEHSARYRACTEPRASRRVAIKRTERLDERILRQPALARAELAIDDWRISEFRGCRSLVLKSGLVVPGGVGDVPAIVPVEVARIMLTGRRAALTQLVVAHARRLSAAGHRLAHITLTPFGPLVDAMCVASVQESMAWTGRVGPGWSPPPALRAQWVEPISSEVMNVAEAVAHDPHPRRDGVGFAFFTAAERLFVAVGPLDGGYYLHRSLALLGDSDASVAAVKRRAMERVALIAQLRDPLGAFAIEGLQIKAGKERSYHFVTRRILLAWQRPLWRAPPLRPAPTRSAPGAEDTARPDESSEEAS